MLRFSANLSMLFLEYSFLERFDKAAQAGFRGVEFMGRDADLVVMIDRQIPSDDLIVHFF